MGIEYQGKMIVKHKEIAEQKSSSAMRPVCSKQVAAYLRSAGLRPEWVRRSAMPLMRDGIKRGSIGFGNGNRNPLHLSLLGQLARELWR